MHWFSRGWDGDWMGQDFPAGGVGDGLLLLAMVGSLMGRRPAGGIHCLIGLNIGYGWNLGKCQVAV